MFCVEIEVWSKQSVIPPPNARGGFSKDAQKSTETPKCWSMVLERDIYSFAEAKQSSTYMHSVIKIAEKNAIHPCTVCFVISKRF